jgi:hypothetical protein
MAGIKKKTTQRQTHKDQRLKQTTRYKKRVKAKKKGNGKDSTKGKGVLLQINAKTGRQGYMMKDRQTTNTIWKI